MKFPVPIAGRRNLAPPSSREAAHGSSVLALTLVCLLFVWGCTGPERRGEGIGVLEGKISLAGTGVAGAEVVLRRPDFHVLPEAEVIRVRSGDGGDFRLQAAPGTYLLTAQMDGYFGFFGRNPLHISSRLSGVNLPLVETHPVLPARTDPGAEKIEGRVLWDGQPVAGARVFAYVDLSRGARGPGYATSAPTGPDGEYLLTVSPGTYFVAARWRQKEWRGGSLEPGDLFGVLPVFPLTVAEAEAVRADIETVEVPAREQMVRYTGSSATLSGIIVGPDGTPVAGMHACLYAAPEMLDRPVVVSEPSDRDGSFSLETTLTGQHYLGARKNLGGPPRPGELVGFYRGPQGTRIQLEEGRSLADLRIVAQVVP